MKKNLLIIGFLCFAGYSYGQQINIVSANETVEKIQRTGLKVHLNHPESEVSDGWKDYLRKFGKVESSGHNYVVNEGKVSSISNKPVRLVSKVEQDGKNESYVFLAVDNGKDYITAGDPQYLATQQFLKDFAIKMHKNVWGDKVEDAEKIVSTAQRDFDKKVDKDKDLNKAIEKSKQNVIDYQKKIEAEQAKQVELGKQVVENKKAIESSAVELEKAKKEHEAMKTKLGEIK